MYGFRYHLVTVIAVFMALGIGILLGGSMGQDLFANEQIEVLTRLEQKYSASREENTKWSQKVNDLSKQTEQFDLLIRQISDRYVKGKLAGKKIIVLQSEKEESLPIISYIHKAGGQVEAVISIKEALKEAANFADSQVLRFLADGLSGTPTSADWVNSVHSQNVFDIKGNVFAHPDAIILIGSNNKNSSIRVQQVDIPLVKELQKRDLRVIGVERTNTDPTLIPIYRNLRIPTIDNLDQATGLLTLIEVINGKNGNYGIKPTADQLAPRINDVLLPEETEMQAG